MVSIDALMNALPVSGLEPDDVAHIEGFVDKFAQWNSLDSFHLLEPPAVAREPFIAPAHAIASLARGIGLSTDHAKKQAKQAAERMMEAHPCWGWVYFYDSFDPELPACIPISTFIDWLRIEWPTLRKSMLVGVHELDVSSTRLCREALADGNGVADFLAYAADVIVRAPMFPDPADWQHVSSMRDRVALTQPKAMIEFMPGAPWPEFEEPDSDDWGAEWISKAYPLFSQWREQIRPIADALSETLGQSVYYFADPEDDLDDDCVHRFLVLHWCCTWLPESNFVKHLVNASGAASVHELKAALIDPQSYRHPFEMNHAFFAPDAVSCQFDYSNSLQKITWAFVFATLEAREAAYWLLQQAIGVEVLIVAPRELADNEWVEKAASNCAGWSVRFMHDHAVDEPIAILAGIDRLNVIADHRDRERGSFDPQLSDSVEDLLWLAIQHGVDARYFFLDRCRLGNPEDGLERRGAAEREAVRQTQRAEYTRRLTAIQVECDYGSTGLWDECGRNLSYDALDLPFDLIRRIAAWQADFDEIETPPSRADESWRHKHESERLVIIESLRAVLGSDIVGSGRVC